MEGEMSVRAIDGGGRGADSRYTGGGCGGESESETGGGGIGSPDKGDELEEPCLCRAEL